MHSKRFRPVYLLFFAIPLLYYILHNKSNIHHSSNKQDYFYFSVRTTEPAVISLFAAEDSLTSWGVNSAGYKYLDYVGRINDSCGISLRIKNLSANDTVSFLSFNIAHGDSILSLYDAKNCSLKSAVTCETGDALTAVVKDTGASVDVRLPKISSWEKPSDDSWFNRLIIISFIIIFVLIVLLAPPVRYFIFSCCLAIVVMLLFYLMGKDFNCSVTFKTSSQPKIFQTFCNYDPCFSVGKMASSDNAGNFFCTPVDLAVDNCIRCDADGASEWGDAHYKISAGIISCKWNLASVPLSRMAMNDLMLRDGKFIVTGDDPHFSFTSNYFTDGVQRIILIRKNLFLFISIFLFFILMIFHRLICRIRWKRFQTVYLCYFIIPATYYFFTIAGTPEKPEGKKDQIYFSVKTSVASLIELKDAGKLVASWDVDSSGYKFLQYSADSIDADASPELDVKNLKAGDTISILSINAFKNGNVITCHDNESCRITNAKMIHCKGTIDAVAGSSDSSVSITLPALYSWHKPDHEKDFQKYVILIFIIVFILIVLFAPSAKYFLAICVSTLMLMLILYWAFVRIRGQAAMQTSCPVRSVDFFYNDDPSFSADKKVSIYDWASFYKTDLPLAKNLFLRCDINENTKELKDFKVMLETEYFMKEIDLNNVSSDKMLINDLNYKNGTFVITGTDPYFCLTSDYFVQKLQSMILLRRNLFLFISLVIFLVMLWLRKPVNTDD